MTQITPAPQWKSLLGCLARRVLSISLLLLVLPLLIHAFLLYKEGLRQSVTDNLNQLSLLARSEGTFIQQLINENLMEMKTIEVLEDYAHKDFKQENATLAQIALSEELTSCFVAEKSSNNYWTILAAANPERLSQKDIDNDQYNKILALGTSVYLISDPLIGKKELRIGHAFSENRIFIFGRALENLSSQLIKIPASEQSPIVAFMKTDSDVYFSNRTNFEVSESRLFSPEELFELSMSSKQNLKLESNESFIGVKIPIGNNAFYLVIALTKQEFFGLSSTHVFNHLLQLAILFAVVGGGSVFYLASRIARPIKQLFKCLDKVGEGDLKIRYENDPLGFELNVLGQEFNQMLENLEAHIQEAKQERLSKELLKQELIIGQEIQSSILKTSLQKSGDFIFAHAFLPAKEVSGDFFDVYKIDDKNVLLSVADTAGKGISACLYSLGCRSVLRALAKSGMSLDLILTKANELLLDDAEYQGTFITAFIAILNIEESLLTYSCCGHHPALLLNGKNIDLLTTEGMALGVDQNLVFQTKTHTIEPNQKILIYTDGVVEAQNKQDLMYGFNNLKTLLSSQSSSSAQILIGSLQKDVEKFIENSPLYDDLTILCIERLNQRE